LYIYKPKVKETSNKPAKHVNMISTVAENKTFFTNRQLERAKQARDLAYALGCPSDKDMRAVLRLNMIKDCPVVEEDIILAEKIFGKDVAVIKGKTTRSTPKPVLQDTVAVPKALKEAQRDVTLCIDTFYVNKMAFLHTISDKIHYRTSQWIPDRESGTYRRYLEVVFKVYQKAGMSLQRCCPNMAFEFEFTPNIASAHEHVPVVERSIRVVKERCRATLHGNPFKALPRILMKWVVQECTRKLNLFPVKGGCSDVYSPRMIMHEVNLKFDQCKVPQLAYVLAHDEPNPTKSTEPRAIDRIYMRLLTNMQGGHEVFNLNTGEVIHRRNVTQLPVSDQVIAAVEALAKRDSMELFKVETKHGQILHDSSIAGVERSDQTKGDQDQAERSEEDEEEDSNEEQSTTEQSIDEPSRDDEESSLEEELQGEEQPKVHRSIRKIKKQEVLNVRGHEQRSYQLKQVNPEIEYDAQDAKVIAMIMCCIQEKLIEEKQVVGTQHVITYSLKSSVKKFGKQAEEAASKEMKQMIDRRCFNPISKAQLNDIEKRRAMESLIFLSEKKDGSVKA
jgi:hypothetical protein